ncbi:MAG: helix-turn-helix domain-containing protein [Spirulina sp. SIO3F2]|nr:helix-turn-helix domain-containing protein [Spirulina sp. SIO3F2]
MMDEAALASHNQTSPSSNSRQHYIKIGKRLREARITQGLSTQDLSDCTRVSRSVIRALEAGDQTRFPEDIYLRSLVERLGKALGWDNISQELPSVKVANVLPSWYNPQLTARFNLGVTEETPVQAYMSYILLLTGLVSSLGWMAFSEWHTQAQQHNSESATVKSQQCLLNCQPGQKETGAMPTVSNGIEWSH